MKISRKKLRKIINEFLDTSRPISDQPIPNLEDLTKTSVYDQLTNSERSAFISAMEIAGGKNLNQNLSEGSVIKGPWTGFEEYDFEEDYDPDGDVTRAELEDADLVPVHHLPPTPPTPEEEENLQRKITTARLSNLPSDDDLDAMWDLYAADLERKRDEEEENLRSGVPTLRSVMPHFYDK